MTMTGDDRNFYPNTLFTYAIPYNSKFQARWQAPLRRWWRFKEWSSKFLSCVALIVAAWVRAVTIWTVARRVVGVLRSTLALPALMALMTAAWALRLATRLNSASARRFLNSLPGSQRTLTSVMFWAVNLSAILCALGWENDGEITEIAEADFLAFEELLSHAIHGHVENGGLAFTERMVML